MHGASTAPESTIRVVERMSLLQRRALLGGLLAAPFVVRNYGVLMPVRRVLAPLPDASTAVLLLDRLGKPLLSADMPEVWVEPRVWADDAAYQRIRVSMGALRDGKFGSVQEVKWVFQRGEMVLGFKLTDAA